MPKYFLLENVKMKKKYQDIITSYMGVEPIEINSSLVSAQNRKRLYWTNIPFDEMPENKKLTIEDVIDTEGPYKYLIDTSYAKLKTRVTGINRLDYLEANYVKNYDTFDSCKLAAVIENDTPSKISRQGDRVYSIKGKMPCLTTSTSPKIDAGSPCSMDWRLLTRKEMERGQTVPEGYTTPVSYAAASCMLGNGWTVDVICHLFKNMKF